MLRLWLWFSLSRYFQVKFQRGRSLAYLIRSFIACRMHSLSPSCFLRALVSGCLLLPLGSLGFLFGGSGLSSVSLSSPHISVCVSFSRFSFSFGFNFCLVSGSVLVGVLATPVSGRSLARPASSGRGAGRLSRRLITYAPPPPSGPR